MTHEHGGDDDSVRLAELEALVELGLGKPLDKSAFLQLAKIQSQMRAEQSCLQDLLSKGKISPKDYFVAFNKALRASMEQSKTLLGVEAFEAIFGEGADTKQLIDPEVFFKEYSENS
jgi:hypothetical protein